MVERSLLEGNQERILVRIDTLIRLRWYAIIGQAGAVLVIAFAFGYPMAWAVCLALIAMSAALNLILNQRYRSTHRLPADGTFRLLAFDIAQLGVLLFLTGGLQNPFAFLLLAPVVVSSTSLTQNHTLMLGGFAVAIITFLAVFHLPLPWIPGSDFRLPGQFLVGVWVAIICTLGFTAIYAFRVAEEARKLADALAATELVLQREQHLTDIDGLAAAAAHELGTPLATIALVSKEMVNTLPKDSAMHDDAALLRSQAQRCREILQKLTSLSSEGESIIEQKTIMAFLEDVVSPLRELGVEIEIVSFGKNADEPKIMRSPGLNYGLTNLIDNAIVYAKHKVTVEADWRDGNLQLKIFDDGKGFPESIRNRIGEPFLTSRQQNGSNRPRGLGLGLFISKTLLERNGAELAFSNLSRQEDGQTGACITIKLDSISR